VVRIGGFAVGKTSKCEPLHPQMVQPILEKHDCPRRRPLSISETQTRKHNIHRSSRSTSDRLGQPPCHQQQFQMTDERSPAMFDWADGLAVFVPPNLLPGKITAADFIKKWSHWNGHFICLAVDRAVQTGATATAGRRARASALRADCRPPQGPAGIIGFARLFSPRRTRIFGAFCAAAE
jgi:hypothetical protein